MQAYSIVIILDSNFDGLVCLLKKKKTTYVQRQLNGNFFYWFLVVRDGREKVTLIPKDYFWRSSSTQTI